MPLPPPPSLPIRGWKLDKESICRILLSNNNNEILKRVITHEDATSFNGDGHTPKMPDSSRLPKGVPICRNQKRKVSLPNSLPPTLPPSCFGFGAEILDLGLLEVHITHLSLSPCCRTYHPHLLLALVKR